MRQSRERSDKKQPLTTLGKRVSVVCVRVGLIDCTGRPLRRNHRCAKIFFFFFCGRSRSECKCSKTSVSHVFDVSLLSHRGERLPSTFAIEEGGRAEGCN